MTLIPCLQCVSQQMEIASAIRAAERARARGKDVSRLLAAMEKPRREIRECTELGHPSMQAGHDATRRRHAASRPGDPA